MGNHTIITLKKGGGRTIKAGGLWIFDNEIESIMGRFKNGDIVTVHDFDGYPMGRGYINQNSKIRIRLMTRNVHQEIDRDFLTMRLQNAWDYRKKTVDTDSCRIVFGDADFLPGLVIDKFSDVLVVQSLALGIDRFKEQIVEILKEILKADGIDAAVINMATIKPIDRDIIIDAAKKTGAIVTAEEHNIIGGLGAAVAEVICETVPVPVLRVGVEDTFGKSGPALELLEIFGLNSANICQKAKEAIALKK